MSAGVVQQSDLGILDGNAGDVQCARKNQRHDFHADIYFLGGEEGARTEFGIIAHDQIFGGQRTAPERKAEIAHFHFAAQRFRGLGFDGGFELIHRNQERRNNEKNEDHPNSDENNSEIAAHAAS